jgi:integrase
MAGIRRTKGVAQHQARPVTPEALRAAVEQASPRDRALLLLGFAGAFRRSELVTLDVADLTWSPEGLAVTLRRSKTDQDGEGRVVGIPRGIATVAVEQWIAGRTAGRVFPITAGMVGRIVKRLLGDEYSAHGLRSGFCTAAALAGKDALAIQRQTGHKSLVQLAKYCRPGLFEKNAGEGIL